MSGPEAEITAAAIRMEPVFGQTEANVATSIARMEDAAAQGARIVVLPAHGGRERRAVSSSAVQLVTSPTLIDQSEIGWLFRGPQGLTAP